MFQASRQIDVQERDSVTCNMDSPQPSTPQSSQPMPPSASSSDTTSPALSFFSKGHTARSGSSTSSIASSPAPRDSLEIFGSSKRLLTDVKEEPLEREDADMTEALSSHSGTDHVPGPLHCSPDQTTLNLPSAAHYNFNENETTDIQLSANSAVKKQRSGDSPMLVVANRVGTRFPSFSRKWKSRTGASPKLSIITHSDTIRSRTNSVSSQLISPALSAISKHEGLLTSSPVQAGVEDGSNDLGPAPIDAEEVNAHAEEDQGQATTPLLPPIMMELCVNNPFFHSPLQSPTVAETPSLPSSTTPAGTPQLPCLPSPPLSSKPSIASIRQRSRAGTVVPSSEIPPLRMLGECDDEWSVKLGHANFTIYPEPHLPSVFDMEGFKQLRDDWEHARHSYAKHLALTGEHYGTTSKTYLLTEQKWASIDAKWKKNNVTMTDALEHLIAPTSVREAESLDSPTSSAILEQPPTKVIVPKISDATGKFPDMGDEGIVGPMAVVPPRAMTMQQLVEPAMQNRLSKKRNFLKFISDILGRGVGSGLRT